MNRSSSCSQFVKHVCNASPLTDTSSWIGKNGKTHKFWYGNGKIKEGCQCFASKNCTQFGRYKNLCNCDGFGDDLTDEGFISSTEHLPVTQINHGSINSFGNIKYFLGPLTCTGKIQPYRSENEQIQKTKLINKLANLNETLINTIKTFDRNLKNSTQFQVMNFDKTHSRFTKEISKSSIIFKLNSSE